MGCDYRVIIKAKGMEKEKIVKLINSMVEIGYKKFYFASLHDDYAPDIEDMAKAKEFAMKGKLSCISLERENYFSVRVSFRDDYLELAIESFRVRPDPNHKIERTYVDELLNIIKEIVKVEDIKECIGYYPPELDYVFGEKNFDNFYERMRNYGKGNKMSEEEYRKKRQELIDKLVKKRSVEKSRYQRSEDIKLEKPCPKCKSKEGIKNDWDVVEFTICKKCNAFIKGKHKTCNSELEWFKIEVPEKGSEGLRCKRCGMEFPLGQWTK